MFFLTELKEGLVIAFRAIKANKMRSILTTLGIVIGIVSVTSMGTAIEGLNRAFYRSISSMGNDVLYVEKFPWFMGDEFFSYRNRRDITVKYVKAIQEEASFALAVAPTVGTRRSVKYKQKETEGIRISGTTDQWIKTSGTSLADGRFFSVLESEGARPVCVIGSEVRESLFPLEDPIGKSVNVGGHQLRIVGVLERQGSLLGLVNLDNVIYTPIGQFFADFGSRGRYMQIGVKVSSMTELDEAKEELTGIMRRSRGLRAGQSDDFAINQQELFARTFDSISLVIAAIGLFITGLSLFVGGIGIMNIMFVSVTERTREIGVRKAIGAKRRTIMFQFLIEAAVLCLFGGIIGLCIAFPISLLVNNILPTAMPLSIIGIALLVSVFTGIVSGLLPAYRAAKMDPVEALRYE
jgi:putative ABC transport system permease protein